VSTDHDSSTPLASDPADRLAGDAQEYAVLASPSAPKFVQQVASHSEISIHHFTVEARSADDEHDRTVATAAWSVLASTTVDT
jgi:hypothetical protein